jgi:hypothetical protein
MEKAGYRVEIPLFTLCLMDPIRDDLADLA